MSSINFVLSFLVKLGKAFMLPVVFFALFLLFKIVRWNNPFAGIGSFFIVLLLILAVFNVINAFKKEKAEAVKP